MIEPATFTLRSVLENAVVALGYLVGAQIGFYLAFLNSQVSPVWIALAAVLIGGRRVVPGVFVGAFLANYLHNPHWPTAILIGIGNTLSVVISALSIRYLSGDRGPFSRVSDVLKFITLGTMPGAAVSAVIGVTSLYLFDFVRSTD